MENIDLGQIFTPKIIADFMVELFTLDKYSKVLDPCFGEGIFLTSMIENTNYFTEGIELDEKLFNKVRKRELYNECNLYNADFLNFEFKDRYDGIIMNPPYVRQEKIDDLLVYGITKERLQNLKEFKKLSKTSNLYMYFIIKALDILKVDGELVVIFPSTWMKSKNAGRFKSELSKKCSIDKQIFIKGDVFGKEVLVDVVVLKLVKGVKQKKCEKLVIGYDGEKIYPLDDVGVLLNDKNHVRLEKYSHIRRGITTGNNKLFISDFSKIYEFRQYIKEIISSPKSIKGYSTEGARVDHLLVIKNDLDDLNIEVRQYLLDAKNEIMHTGKPKTLASQIERGLEWYKLKTYDSQGIIFSYIIRETMKFVMNSSDFNIRDNFYIIYPKIDRLLLFGLLNNYYTYSRLEDMGKQYGGGILKLQKYDLDNVMVLNVDYFSQKDIESIKQLSLMLITSGESNLIYDISNIVSKYESIPLDDIIKKYKGQRESRLMKGGKK